MSRRIVTLFVLLACFSAQAATLFSDNFNRADNTDFGVALTEVKGNHQIVSNAAQIAAYNSASNFADLRADTDAHAAVADCRVTVTRVSGTAFDALVYARGSGTDATFTGYVLNVFGANNIDVYRFVSGHRHADRLSQCDPRRRRYLWTRSQRHGCDRCAEGHSQ